MPTEIENDPFFQLLTDALRAGPASPPWRDAVAKLRDAGGTGEADEHRLLIEARQNLEVGKGYRHVRPGPGFTRKVLTNVDAERQSRGGRHVPIAGIVTILAIIVLLGVVVYVARLLVVGGGNGDAATELAGRYFPTTVASANFSGALANDFSPIGRLKLSTNNGLRLGDGAKSAADALGGGLAWSQPLKADEPFAIEAHVRPGPAAGDQLAEMFVSTSMGFSRDCATASHELVWLIRGHVQQVVRDGSVIADIPATPTSGQSSIDVRMVLNKSLAIVEVDHHRVWSGSNGLGEGDRYVGARILTTAPGVIGKKAEPAILDWKVLK